MPRWFNWKFSIFYKLALAFLLVITPLTYISLHFIKSGKRSVEEELQRSIDSRVQYYANLLEIDMARVTKLQREQLIDRDLLNMIYAASIFTDFERSQTMLRIRHNLELIAGTSNFVEKASAYMPTLGRVASNLYYGALPEEEYKAVETSVGQTGDESLMNWNGRLLQNMAYPKQAQAASGTGEAPTLVLSIEFSVPKLRQALAQLADYEQSGAFLYDLERGSPIVTANERDAIAGRLTEARLLEVNGINNRKGRLDIGLTQATLDGTSYLVAMRPVPALHAAVVAYVAERDVYGKIDAYSGWIAELAIVAVVIVLFFSYWIYRIIHQPLALLVKSFRHAEKGQLVPIGSTSRHDEFGYLYKQYNRTIEKLDELIHQVYEQKLRAQASELKQLQSQINPHFLYNTYFTLYRLAMIEDNESVARFSSYLGEYFHYITRHPDDAVPLRLEVKHTQTYAEIQRFRFDDRITTFWDPVPDDAAELVVPKLILQPIIENAYKHGLENKLTGGGLRIRFRHDAAAATLAIAIEDNGSVVSLQDAAGWTLPLHARDEAAEGTGLRNVHRRLQLMYGETSGITLAVSEEFGGLQVMLTIRYGKKEQP